MLGRPSLARPACALALCLTGTAATTLAADDHATLAVGSAMPPLEGTSIAGAAVRLPSAAPGVPLVVVIGPTKQSSTSAAAWSHAFFNAYGKKVGVYGVALLDQVPGLFRGFATNDVRKSAPASQEPHGSNVLISTDRSYRPFIPSGDAADAVVILTDARDRVLSVTREPYTAAAFAALRKTLP